jgi:predicted GTPase
MMARPIDTEYWTLAGPQWNSAVREFTWTKYRVTAHRSIRKVKPVSVDEMPDSTVTLFSVVDQVVESVEPVETVSYPVPIRVQMLLAWGVDRTRHSA